MESVLNQIGNFPAGCEEARREKRFIHVPKDQMLHVIHGKENHVVVSFFFSTDQGHLGIMTIPANKFSDTEIHDGDEVLLVLEGKLQICAFDKGEDPESVAHLATEVGRGEKFFIPEGVKHQYFNLSQQILKILFAIAPRL